MRRNLIIGALAGVAIAVAGATALAQAQYGTAAEAKAMLEKAVTAVKAGHVALPPSCPCWREDFAGCQ